MPPRLISRQLAHPSGMWARIIGWHMNRNNAAMNAYAVKQLDVQQSDRVLEVGFGGGVALPFLMRNASFVAGIDPSAQMAKWANAKYATYVRSGRAAFSHGTVAMLPYSAASFEKVSTVNSIYFWPSLDEGFKEIGRVLSPGGRLAVGFLPKEWMDRMDFPADIFKARSPIEIKTSLSAAGFASVSSSRPNERTSWVVIAAMRQ